MITLNLKAPVTKRNPKVHQKNVQIKPLMKLKSAPKIYVSKFLSSMLNNDLELDINKM